MLTSVEKPTQLLGNSSEIPDLALNMLYRGHVEHGVAAIGYTSFPIPTAMAATFNVDLFLDIATVISTEGRALYNSKHFQDTAIFENSSSTDRRGRGGMSWFDPFVNLFIDPRWGRGQETPGEDPHLASQYAIHFVRGLQGNNTKDPLYDAKCQKSIATCKEFVGYGMEKSDNTDRHHFNAVIDDYDLTHTHYPPFQACVAEKVSAIMCAYNAINNYPSCSSPLINRTLRQEWGYDGFVISDVGAVEEIYETHGFASSLMEAAVDALKAGVDVDSNDTTYETYLPQAVDKGLVTKEDFDVSIARTYTERMRTGEWNPSGCRYDSLNASLDVHTSENVALALRTARESIVLLKNEDDILPLSRNVKVAIVGPNANATETLLGIYHGIPKPGDIISPLAGISAKLPVNNILYAPGCQSVACANDKNFNAAIDAARKADVVVAVLGLEPVTIEGEMQDRVSLDLPGMQNQLVGKIMNKTGKPLVVVLLNGGPVALEWLSGNAAAILEAWYGGEQAGNAIADVLFGDYNPGGRLPITVYPSSYVEQVEMTDMRMRPSGSFPGRTYRYYTGRPVYSFGHGMSYTAFKYDNCIGVHEVPYLMAGKCVVFCVTVQNVGKLEGDEVVLAYADATVTPDHGKTHLRERTLFGFVRIHLAQKEAKTVRFEYTPPDHIKREPGVNIQIGELLYQLELKK